MFGCAAFARAVAYAESAGGPAKKLTFRGVGVPGGKEYPWFPKIEKSAWVGGGCPPAIGRAAED